MNIIEQHRKFKQLSSKTVLLVQNLVKLRKLGKTDQEIQAAIMSLNLPFALHLFLMGNYSDLMKYYGG